MAAHDSEEAERTLVATVRRDEDSDRGQRTDKAALKLEY